MIDAELSKVTGYLKDTAQRFIRDAAYPVPAFRLSVDDLDIAQKISPRLMSMELTDNRGVEADQLTITLSDHDGLLTIPPKGAVLRLWLGWSDTGLVDKGTYITTTSTVPRNRRPLPAAATTSKTCATPTATNNQPCALRALNSDACSVAAPPSAIPSPWAGQT